MMARRFDAPTSPEQPAADGGWRPDHSVFRDSGGELFARQQQGMVEFRAVGHLSRGMAERMSEFSASFLGGTSPRFWFADWTALASYDLDARLGLTAWFDRHHARFAEFHILSASRLINIGISVAQERLGDGLTAHTERAVFESARTAAWAVCSAPSVPHPPSGRVRRDKPTLQLRGGTLVDGRYRLKKPLGDGTTGSVYLAQDEALGRPTALKFMHPSGDASKQARLEARALASMRHENVAAIYSAGRHQEREFVAMEFIRGTSFADLVQAHSRRGVRLPLTSALNMLAQVARGLSAVHARGLVHRDVKPANIVIERVTGRAVLVDFGLAFSLTTDADDTSRVVGTPAYLAPELCGPRRLPPSPQSDLYALGATAYELLTGEAPFDASGDIVRTFMAHVSETPKKPSLHRPELACVDDLLLKLLAKDPSARPVSGSQVALAFSAIMGELTQAPRRRDGRLRVVVMSGDRDRRALLRDAALRAYGVGTTRVVTCATGADALAALDEGPAELVLVESAAPDMHGVEFLAQLRARGGSRALEIVVQPDSQDGEWRFRAMGVQHFVQADDSNSLSAELTAIGHEHGWV